ncbi:hypothetical protein HG263_21640 [Pseudoalteromonas sp. JBTF-M23]|uniref:Uncharacterized protein n=1 Tax=Pseudoalteromonas caenipelagi TaxID=2726988 RepID=A0A849VNH3_9GAMM|nr:hypothetical protein [Pseudoalteromonas caenipelagi]NOU53107.1 hypothetical protein [Pseudoalteromonas caenipelagi]
MKNVVFTVALSSTLLSTATVAQEQPHKVKHECGVRGCSLICKDLRTNQWETIVDQGVQVTTYNYPNGNMEFFFDRGVKEDERIIIGQDKLNCKVKGFR